MGLIPVANHLALINACYPLKLLIVTPLDELRADSNALSKLCYYAAGRPRKLNKVALAVLDRATKDARALGAKARADMAVTVDVMRGLVSDSGCRSELQCFAEQALKVVELGLTRREAGGRDTEIEGRAAGLFHAVATFSSGPLLGLDEALAQQYLVCLRLLSSMAQLGGNDATSRWIALAALDGAVASSVLYASSSNYDAQIELIVPAILFNCLEAPVSELQELSDASAMSAVSLDVLLASRKSPSINPPTSSPSSSELATKAVQSLTTVFALSQGVQLVSKLNALRLWLDGFKNGSVWSETPFIEWIGATSVSTTAVQYRAGVVEWWADQVIAIDVAVASSKPTALVSTLCSILRGPTSLVGLGIGGVLGQLTSLLVRRAGLADKDPLTPLILSAISALGYNIYYFEQMNDLVSDLIDSLRIVKNGGGEASSYDDEERSRAMGLLVTALRGVLNEAKEGTGEVQKAVPLRKSLSIKSTKSGKSTKSRKSTDATTSDAPAIVDGMGRPIMEVEGAGRRHYVSTHVFHESLFLLTDTDASVRIHYGRALFVYVATEMEVLAHSDTTADPTPFLTELHASIHQLATSASLAEAEDSSNGPSRSASTRKPQRTRSRRSSKGSSRRRSSLPTEETPSAVPADYAGLRELVKTLQGRSSAAALLSGLPMLLALDREGSKMAQAGEGVQARERGQACKEIAAAGLCAMGAAWGVDEVETMGHSAADDLTPSVMPTSFKTSSQGTFTRGVEELPRALDAEAIVEAMSKSSSLQAASGLDQAALVARLTPSWARDVAVPEVAALKIYRDASSRSVSNLSLGRLPPSLTPSRAASIRVPSLADLQNSLGGSQGETRSGAASFTSSSGGNVMGLGAGSYDPKRRTSRTSAAGVLAALGARNGSRLSVIPPTV